MLVLGFAFAASWTVVTAMAVHLPRLLEAAGASTVQAVAAGALIGPSQVGARILEASLMKRFHPMVSARLSVALHPLGAAVLAIFGARRGLRPFHDPARRRQRHSHHCPRDRAAGHVRPGELRLPAGAARRAIPIMMAAAPLLFGILIDLYGAGALIVSSALSIAAFLGLCSLRISKAPS